ncbi:MAG: adenylate/guanylate cyclase domain-containing protein [Leptolyngbya sp.]|nr:adenylate/guanylate cyclase domain-containing protein [Leptolyngbya sp.]
MVRLNTVIAPCRQWWEGLGQWVHRHPGVHGGLAIALAGLVATVTTTGTNRLGLLEKLELLAYDQMVRVRHELREPALDDRLLVVTVTEADLNALGSYPLSDQTVAQALAQLQAHNPTAIGLDIYRAVPKGTGQEALRRQLQASNVVVITKLADINSPGIPAPAGVSPAQISFNDVVVDRDGTIRRSLIMGEVTTPEGSTVLFSFSLQLALRYLAQQDITPTASDRDPRYMQLGPSPFVPLQSGSGGYAQVDAGGYQILLNYRRSQAPARTVTLTDVLAGRVQRQWVEGKVVLIGVTAPSVKDLFYTPFTGAGTAATHQMPGVYIHAQMVSQYLDAATGARSLFWLSTPWQEWLWCLGWSLVAGAIAWRLRHPVNLTLAQIGILGVITATGFGLFLHQHWVPLVAPTLGSISTSGLVLAYQAQQSARQRQMMLVLLGQNTSPEIANALWENRDRLLKSGKLPGRKTTATMLFTDIRGFSSLAEITPPEQLLEWLNEYLSAMAEAIQTHHGIINKFTGDGLLAVFGVPITRHTAAAVAQDAQDAVHCALSMAQRLDRLNQDRQAQGLPALQMRVGIFTGPVVVGSLGGQTRMEYGIIGDSVNIASRLESFDKSRQPTPCRILIGHDTLIHLHDRFQVENWGDLMLKGRQTPVQVYRVIDSQRDTAIPAAAPNSSNTPPLPPRLGPVT